MDMATLIWLGKIVLPIVGILGVLLAINGFIRLMGDASPTFRHDLAPNVQDAKINLPAGKYEVFIVYQPLTILLGKIPYDAKMRIHNDQTSEQLVYNNNSMFNLRAKTNDMSGNTAYALGNFVVAQAGDYIVTSLQPELFRENTLISIRHYVETKKRIITFAMIFAGMFSGIGGIVGSLIIWAKKY